MINISTTANSVKIMFDGKEYHYSTKQTAISAISKMLKGMIEKSGIKDDDFYPSNISNKKNNYLKPVKPEIEKEPEIKKTPLRGSNE